MFGLPLAFASPAILAGLIALPIIWWLLRLTPPKPDTEVFPPLRILLLLVKRQETPAKSPWWLTLLRLVLAAIVIFALARPMLNPQAEMAMDDGPLLLLVDNSWASATDWEARQRTGAALIEQAGERGKAVAISATVAPPNAAVNLLDAATAAASFATFEPVSAIPNRAQAIEKLVEAGRASDNATLAVLADGIGLESDDAAFDILSTSTIGKMILFNGITDQVVAISNTENRTDALEVTLIRPPQSALGDQFEVTAQDEKGRLLATTTVNFESTANEAIAAIEAPFDLRNDIATLRISEQSHAASTYLLDENNRRRRFALFSGLAGDEAQPLLSPLYYIERAIEPYADIVRPRQNDLSKDIPEIIEQGPAVIVMADIGVLPNAVENNISEWLNAGGTLVRFAGPRLAASAEDDPFLPVALRAGERALGGALTWTEPQIVAPFPPNSPFAELQAPLEVMVNRQLLAEPDPNLADKTWSSLADGTPLVTGERRGKGSIVLFHVTAEATWSNLPISGSFVDMLRRIADLSANTGASQIATQTTDGGETLTPMRVIRADGELVPPPVYVKPRQAGTATQTSYENPAGLYGIPDAFVALNVLQAEANLDPFILPQTGIEGEVLSYVRDEQRDLSGWLFAAAFLLLIIDTIAMLWINGTLKGRTGKTLAAATISAFITVGGVPIEAHAQDTKPGDEVLLQNLEATRLAYVITGQRATDEITEAGMSGISRFLASRTAFEPGEPIGLDIEVDELSFYPLIYFPIDANADMPSETAIARLDAYMQSGGTVLFDTRDQIGGLLSSNNSAENQRLRAIMRNLNVPPLEPVPEDHVLTKSFFILDSFPGAYAGSPLWVQATQIDTGDGERPVRVGDGVTPIMITGNDFAGAWALDESGRPLRAVAAADPLQRIYAFRSGVNIMMYMLTGNYKADQVHIPALLERLGQ